ncbi:RidA family protein [Pelagicoccus sp. SDUM812002]|uniref:RidA family protein n=1 Tax=Pelagicoccus sp. SDUM812002 TaxID=3041266 RepID=UPI00280F03FD|nr:RidA family protein [Pelagicoccus sp. SDUM812002]MDQ8185322.1 RidA family protein [Pelagicoccus sp. SDUM812002]
MSFNANIGALFLAITFFVFGAFGQDEEASFREPLFFSDLDKDQRTPQAVRVGGVVFVSALDAPGGTLEEQLRTIYIRLQSVLGNYGMRMGDVAQERIYLKKGASYDAATAARQIVYKEGAGPALTIVEVAGFENAGTLVEIELIAVANPEVD